MCSESELAVPRNQHGSTVATLINNNGEYIPSKRR